MKINPLTVKKIKRFKSIKRGYYSLILILIMVFVSICAPLLINKRALVVKYQEKYFFPIYGDIIPGKVFSLNYEYETNYRDLAEIFTKENKGNFVIMPLIPYDPYENDLREDQYPPFSPCFSKKHFLGTDTIGRDILARLVYGFKTAFFLPYLF